MPIRNIDDLLNKIVKWELSLDGVIVVDLATSCVLKHNPSLKKNNPDIYYKLIGDYGVSEAFSSFGKLQTLPDILNNFSTSLNFGDSQYIVIKFTNRFILIHFDYVELLPIVVCYLGTPQSSANAIIRAYKYNNRGIIMAIKDLLFIE